jgi:hypothetical protein
VTLREKLKVAWISRLLKEKGREQFWQKKGQFAFYKEKLEKWTEFTTFRVNKMFPISINTFKTL